MIRNGQLRRGTAGDSRASASIRDIPEALARPVQRPGIRIPDANAERLVYREGVDPLTASDFEQIEFPGITDPARIWTDGQRRFRELAARANTYTVNMDWEHLFVGRGDLVRVMHDALIDAGQVAGRVRRVVTSGPTTVIELDETVTMQAGKLYAIRFRLQDDTFLLRSVAAAPGESNAVRLVGSGFLPLAGDLFAFGEADRDSREMVVKSIESAENLSARLTPGRSGCPRSAGAEDNVPPGVGAAAGRSATTTYRRRPRIIAIRLRGCGADGRAGRYGLVAGDGGDRARRRQQPSGGGAVRAAASPGRQPAGLDQPHGRGDLGGDPHPRLQPG